MFVFWSNSSQILYEKAFTIAVCAFAVFIVRQRRRCCTQCAREFPGLANRPTPGAIECQRWLRGYKRLWRSWFNPLPPAWQNLRGLRPLQQLSTWKTLRRKRWWIGLHCNRPLQRLKVFVNRWWACKSSGYQIAAFILYYGQQFRDICFELGNYKF